MKTKREQARKLLEQIDVDFGKLCGHGHIGLAEKPKRDGYGNNIGPAPGIERTLRRIVRALGAAVLLFAVSCGGQEISQTRSTAVTLTAAQAADIGKPCVSDYSCDPALVCTDKLTWPGETRCAFAVSDLLDCPDDYIGTLTMTATAGVPIILDGTNLTGHFCVPKCSDATACGNGQCCIGFPLALPGGYCATKNPRNDYSVSVACPL